jgi:hypothetical protein
MAATTASRTARSAVAHASRAVRVAARRIGWWKEERPPTASLFAVGKVSSEGGRETVKAVVVRTVD